MLDLRPLNECIYQILLDRILSGEEKDITVQSFRQVASRSCTTLAASCRSRRYAHPSSQVRSVRRRIRE